MTAVAWNDVAARLRPYLARRVSATDLDDVLQDVLLRMHRGLGAVRDDERMTGWMYRIASNAVAERHRDRARHPVTDSPDQPDVADDAADDEHVAATALAACLSIFVARLPSPYREAITLVELEGMTVRAAAAATSASLPAMKSRVLRGRAQLRELLEACCEIAVDARGAVTDVTPRAAPPCCEPAGDRPDTRSSPAPRSGCAGSRPGSDPAAAR